MSIENQSPASKQRAQEYTEDIFSNMLLSEEEALRKRAQAAEDARRELSAKDEAQTDKPDSDEEITKLAS